MLQSLVRQNGINGLAIKEAPEPMLPNYGLGGIIARNIDIDMLSSLNSKERTFSEFCELG